MIPKRLRYNRILLLLVVFFSIVPDIGVRFSTFGFVWTAYRLFVVAAVPLLLFTQRSMIAFPKGSFLSKWIVFLGLWLAYGVALMLLSDYSDVHSALVELLSILYGLMVLLILKQTVRRQSDIEAACHAIYWILTALVLLGLVEIATGFHLRTSAYFDTGSEIAEIVNRHMATGIMYNMNDFSALLTCLSPVLIDKRFGPKRWVTLFGVVAINFVNDATICNLAMILFFGYLYLVAGNGKRVLTFLKRLLFVGAVAFLLFFMFYQGDALTARSDLLGALARQIFNARQSTGSMYYRLEIYRTSLRLSWNGNLLGIGPNAFTAYLKQHVPNSLLVNPHSLPLEILTEYGIFIFSAFALLVVSMATTAYGRYRHTLHSSRPTSMLVLGWLLLYIVSSFAPSTFLGYSYQWLIIGLACRQLDLT